MELIVARITRPHGLRGDVGVELRTDVPDERFAAGNELRTSTGEVLTVARGWVHSGRWIIRFVGVDDRNAAEELRGVELVIDAASAEEEDAWYAHELAGLSVQLPDGVVIGTATGLEHLPAQDALIVTEPSGAQTLVPLVQELVPEVNIAGGYIIVTPPVGLFTDLPAAGETYVSE